MSAIDQPSVRRGLSPFRERLAALLHGSMRSKLLRNILTVVTGTAGAQAITLAFMPVITRIYGPEAYGVLGTFLSVTMMLVPVAALTYPIAIVLPKRDGDARGLVRLSLATALLLAALVALAFYLVGDRLVAVLEIQIVQPYLMLIPFVMFCGAALEICQQWLFRTQRFRITASVAVGHSLLFNSMRTIAGLVQSSALVLVCTTALQQALHAAMLALAMLRAKPHRDNHAGEAGQGDPGVLELARMHSDFPKYRAPVMLINACSQHLPTLVLAAYFGPAAAGFFALCKQALTMPTNLIGKSVADVYYPRISRAIHDREPVAAMLLKATTALGLVGLVPFSVVAVFGPWLFALVFGEQWHVAGEYARWLALAEYVIFVSRPCVVAVPALSLQGRFLLFEVFSTSLRVLSLFVGAVWIGHALATVQAFAVASIVIYSSLMVIVLIASRRWYAAQQLKARQPEAQHPTESFD
ncbi:lipopolysaccharide biosynthesis protein [Stutzerimonas stutzeri]|uniref:Oligosaccharide flippase family protein n=1 Tax=Stutzerimonas stutzeri TaxID=316 RepID=A0A6I6LUS9_STUST|nr:oligosaccharide flippase family protein [Stutzerimonas stutzeri]QGZ32086.1 oligosaccharide flippase family protein [Stutzerimonas stutzeri]